jgi:hypothetical protein
VCRTTDVTRSVCHNQFLLARRLYFLHICNITGTNIKQSTFNFESIQQTKPVILDITLLTVRGATFCYTHPMKAQVPISKSSISHFAHNYAVFCSTIRAMNRVLLYTTICNQSHSMGGCVFIYRHFGWNRNSVSSSLFQ